MRAFSNGFTMLFFLVQDNIYFHVSISIRVLYVPIYNDRRICFYVPSLVMVYYYFIALSVILLHLHTSAVTLFYIAINEKWKMVELPDNFSVAHKHILHYFNCKKNMDQVKNS